MLINKPLSKILSILILNNSPSKTFVNFITSFKKHQPKIQANPIILEIILSLSILHCITHRNYYNIEITLKSQVF